MWLIRWMLNTLRTVKVKNAESDGHQEKKYENNQAKEIMLPRTCDVALAAGKRLRNGKS